MTRSSYFLAFTFLFLGILSVHSQGCANAFQWPNNSVTPTANWATIAVDNWAGDFAVVNVVSGNLYEFSTCAANGSNVTYDSELTLTTNANALLIYNDDFCGLQSYISWTATFTGTVRIHLTAYPCLTNSINSSIRVKTGIAPPAPINNTCANATTLTPSSTCNLVSGSTSAATEDPYTDPSCDPGIINDVWYTFNSGANTSLNLTVNLGTASWIGVEFFTACGVLATGLSLGGIPANCDFNTSAPNPTLISGLIPNTTYRMRLFTNVTFDIPGTFTACLTTPPPPTVSVNSSTICSGQSFTLTATPSTSGGTYLWNNGATTQSIIVNPTSTTTYSVTYTNNGTATGSGTVTVYSLPTINAGQDVTICQGASINLNATGGTSYAWTGGPSTANYNVSPTSTSTFTVSGTDANGCSNTDQVVVNVNPLPVINTISNQTLCSGITTAAVTFSGTAGATYNWINNSPSIGLAASGSGSVPSFIAVNSTPSPVTATITVTPTLVGCNGTPLTYTYTINYAPSATSTVSACENYVWNGQMYTQSGTYVQTIPSNLPCDSVLYLNLTILGPINGETVDVSACNSYSWQGQTYSQSGTYSDTIQTASGCDSIIHLNLTINNSLTGPTTEISACDSYTWNGQTYTQSGTYTYNGTAESGCDSLATLVLTINHGPINTTLVDNAGTLTTTSQNASTYSWLDCTTNTLIPGETGTTYLPTYTGMFASIATNNCGSDTSQCIEMEVQGLNDLNTQTFIIYPNPTKDLITINAQKSKIQTVELIDLNGKSVIKKAINTHVFQLDLTFFSEGIYILKICNSENMSTLHRVVKTNF